MIKLIIDNSNVTINYFKKNLIQLKRIFTIKKQIINIGCAIVFINTIANKLLKTEVVEIHVYKEFSALYSHYYKILINYSED